MSNGVKNIKISSKCFEVLKICNVEYLYHYNRMKDHEFNKTSWNK